MAHLLTRLRKRIKRSLRLEKSFRERWYNEDPRIPVDRHRKKELRMRGFLPNSDLYFEFERYGFEAYVTHRDHQKLHPVNGTFSRLIDNKAFVPILFRNHPEWLPDVCIFFDQGRVNYAYGLARNNLLAGELLKESVKKAGKLLVKPASDSLGNKVQLLTDQNIDTFIHEKRYSRRKYLVNNVLENEAYSADINPHALNTMRVVFFKSVRGVNRVFRILHRFGTRESGIVDNCSKGGMIAVVDRQKGSLGKAIIYTGSTRYGCYDQHIDTGAQITGITLPDWPRKRKTIEQIVAQLDFLEYGGMDLAPTPDGLKILEINSMPDIGITQMEEPALLDQEFREFILSKGYRVG